MLLLLSLLLLAFVAPQDERIPPRETMRWEQYEDWCNVPVFVVPDLEGEGESWMTTQGVRSRRKDLRLHPRITETGSWEVLVSDFIDVILELKVLGDGEIRARACGVWHTDIGPNTMGPIIDLHGTVVLEERTAKGERPIRLRFELAGIETGGDIGPQPTRTRGEVVLSAESVTWNATFVVSESPDGDSGAPAEELSLVTIRGPKERIKARGRVDRFGRRQGKWSTWYETGVRQSSSVFRDGIRHGSWISYLADGRIYEQGNFEDGMRSGRWVERSPYFDSMSTNIGFYEMDRKTGEWIDFWGDGTMRARGSYENGRATGLWRRWWPNGTKQSEGYVQDGLPAGHWTLWHEDGVVKEERTYRERRPRRDS